MKNIITATILLFSCIIFGQKKKSIDDILLFERTVAIQELLNEELGNFTDLYDSVSITDEERTKQEIVLEIRENVLDKVIENYEDLIRDYPKSNLVFRALNNKGFAELQLEDYEKAKETFSTLLNSKANDKEKGGVGSGIMGEPYANYKNRACKILAGLELKSQNYQEALHYLDQTKKYPYRHFCGNEYAADEIYMAKMYSECYLGLNQYDKAYDILLPNIIENGLASNSQLIHTTFQALLKNYKKEDLKIQFENAFKNVKAEKEKVNKEEYTMFYIYFLDRKIKLNSWQLHEFLTEQEREKVMTDILTHSEFYNLLSQ